MKLSFRAVDRDSWPDFAALFEARGGPKACWCMVWRASPAEARQKDGASRRAQIKARVERGVPIGLIGYHDGTAVAWCSIAPRGSYRPLGGAPADDETVWSLACFFVPRPHRGQGLTAQLIAAACDHARRGGATVKVGA